MFHALGGITAARAEVQRRAGGHLDPDLARRFDADAAALLAGLDRTSVWDEFLAAEPQRREVAADALEPLFEAFALFADMKSAYGHGHSTGVAALARAAAQAQGLPAAEATTLAHAALLHDLGRVCVPTGLWDNPGTLSAAEWERVRLHAYFTDRVLRQSPALSALAEIAGRAHEKLDGAGYPRGDRAPALGRAMRLLAAADVYHACTETRAHRPAHAPDAAVRELRAEVAAGRLCHDAADAVLAAAGHVRPLTPRASDALTERECEVIRLLASGHTNKQIGKTLGISPRTVQHHRLHIYDKIGVQSRAGAALYAAEHGLAH